MLIQLLCLQKENFVVKTGRIRFSKESKWEGQSVIQTLDDSKVHLGMFSLDRPRPE